MNWACDLSTNAERDLRGLPKAIQRRVARVLTQMSADPFQGNLRALRGLEWKGVFRRRIGDSSGSLSHQPEKAQRDSYGAADDGAHHKEWPSVVPADSEKSRDGHKSTSRGHKE